MTDKIRLMFNYMASYSVCLCLSVCVRPSVCVHVHLCACGVCAHARARVKRSIKEKYRFPPMFTIIQKNFTQHAHKQTAEMDTITNTERIPIFKSSVYFFRQHIPSSCVRTTSELSHTFNKLN